MLRGEPPSQWVQGRRYWRVSMWLSPVTQTEPRPQRWCWGDMGRSFTGPTAPPRCPSASPPWRSKTPPTTSVKPPTSMDPNWSPAPSPSKVRGQTEGAASSSQTSGLLLFFVVGCFSLLWRPLSPRSTSHSPSWSQVFLYSTAEECGVRQLNAAWQGWSFFKPMSDISSSSSS